MLEVTKIRGKQINLPDFIKNPSVNDEWNSTTFTASQSAIIDKINASITGVTGAMIFKGPVTAVPTTGLNAGQVYVWSSNSAGSIAAASSATGKAETIEKGDTLIYTNDSKWLVIQYNIAGAMTEALWAAGNYVDDTASNGVKLVIDQTTHKLKVVRTYPNDAASGVGLEITPQGAITAATQDVNDNSTNVATTEYADRAAQNAEDDTLSRLNLDSPITNTAGKTVATITETDGVVNATFQNIAITTGQVTNFADAFKSRIGDYNDGGIADVEDLKTTSNILACFMNGVDVTPYCSCAQNGKLTIDMNGVEYEESDVIRVLFV